MTTSSRPGISDRSTLRRTGALVGLVVAALFLMAGFPILLDNQRLDAVTLLLSQGIPTLAAGTIGGWSFAPWAERASIEHKWRGLVLSLGLLVLIVGAVGVGLALALESAVRDGLDIGQILFVGIAGGLMAAAIGLILLGWLLLPVTTLAAGIWALVMARLLRRAPARTR